MANKREPLVVKVTREVEAKLYLIDDFGNKDLCTEKDLYKMGYGNLHKALMRAHDSLVEAIGYDGVDTCSALRYLIDRAVQFDPEFSDLGPLNITDQEDAEILKIIKSNLENWIDPR